MSFPVAVRHGRHTSLHLQAVEVVRDSGGQFFQNACRFLRRAYAPCIVNVPEPGSLELCFLIPSVEARADGSHSH